MNLSNKFNKESHKKDTKIKALSKNHLFLRVKKYNKES